ncbi:MAG: cupin domain-containing protein [Thermoplasmata archaeon]|nr:cupin domain-containing protein [Thermoplasmata archaeon]
MPDRRGPLSILGVTMYIQVTGAETGGSYSIMEHIFPPGGGPEFLHTHPAQESIMIREGTFDVYSKGPKGKEATRAGPGDVHHVASQGAHGLKNVGDAPGRAFIVFHPADLQEKFFLEFDELFSKPAVAPDPTRLRALFAKHNFVLLERPPGM